MFGLSMAVLSARWSNLNFGLAISIGTLIAFLIGRLIGDLVASSFRSLFSQTSEISKKQYERRRVSCMVCNGLITALSYALTLIGVSWWLANR